MYAAVGTLVNWSAWIAMGLETWENVDGKGQFFSFFTFCLGSFFFSKEYVFGEYEIPKQPDFCESSKLLNKFLKTQDWEHDFFNVVFQMLGSNRLALRPKWCPVPMVSLCFQNYKRGCGSSLASCSFAPF